jgi:peptidoglycan-associated lipoprotein
MKPTSILFAIVLVSLAACSKKDVKSDAALQQQGKDQSAEEAAARDGSRLRGDGSQDMFGAQDVAGMLRVHFAFDSSILSPEAQKNLRNNADYLRNNPTARVVIEGHTDERGSAQYNLALGERRAKAVRDYLVMLGIDAQRLETVSYGAEMPIAEGRNEQAFQENRRAQFRGLQ